jgi:hypothetical protein
VGAGIEGAAMLVLFLDCGWSVVHGGAEAHSGYHALTLPRGAEFFAIKYICVK